MSSETWGASKTSTVSVVEAVFPAESVTVSVTVCGPGW